MPFTTRVLLQIVYRGFYSAECLPNKGLQVDFGMYLEFLEDDTQSLPTSGIILVRAPLQQRPATHSLPHVTQQNAFPTKARTLALAQFRVS